MEQIWKITGLSLTTRDTADVHNCTCFFFDYLTSVHFQGKLFNKLLHILRDLCLLDKQHVNTSTRKGEFFSEAMQAVIINYKGEPCESWCTKQSEKKMEKGSMKHNGLFSYLFICAVVVAISIHAAQGTRLAFLSQQTEIRHWLIKLVSALRRMFSSRDV